MKKGLSVVLFVLMALAIIVSSALAAPAQAGKNVALKSVSYEKGGITLVFSTSGLSKNDLKGASFMAHSNQQDIYCTFINNSTDVNCTVSKGLSQYAGETFHGTLAGFYFSGILPKARSFPVIVTETPDVNEPPVEEEVPATCEEGSALVYEYVYSRTTERYLDSYLADIVSHEEFLNTYGWDYEDYLDVSYSEYKYTYSGYLDGGLGMITLDEYLSVAEFFGRYMWFYSSLEITETVYPEYYYWGYVPTVFIDGDWTWAEDWAATVTMYEDEGYTIEKTGEYCGLVEDPENNMNDL